MTAPEGNEKRYSLQQMPSNSNFIVFFSLCYRSYFGMYYCAATFPVCPNWIQIGINRIYNSNFKTNSPVPSTKLFNLEMNFVLISSQWQRKHAPDWKGDDETTNIVEQCNRIFQMKDKQWHGVQCTAQTIIKIDVDNKKKCSEKVCGKMLNRFMWFSSNFIIGQREFAVDVNSMLSNHRLLAQHSPLCYASVYASCR